MRNYSEQIDDSGEPRVEYGRGSGLQMVGVVMGKI